MFNDKIMCIVSAPLLLRPPVGAAALLPVSGVAGVPHPGPARGAVPHPRHRVLVLTIYFLALADIFPCTPPTSPSLSTRLSAISLKMSLAPLELRCLVLAPPVHTVLYYILLLYCTVVLLYCTTYGAHVLAGDGCDWSPRWRGRPPPLRGPLPGRG